MVNAFIRGGERHDARFDVPVPVVVIEIVSNREEGEFSDKRRRDVLMRIPGYVAPVPGLRAHGPLLPVPRLRLFRGGEGETSGGGRGPPCRGCAPDRARRIGRGRGGACTPGNNARSPLAGLQGNQGRVRLESVLMSSSYTQLYVHLVWTTFGRSPLLHASVHAALNGYLHARARALECQLLAAGGVEDHVHVLARLHPTIDVARLVRELKAPSSGYVRRHLGHSHFSWQDGYGAFSLRKEEVATVRAYIGEQPRHHREGTLVEPWEATLPGELDDE